MTDEQRPDTYTIADAERIEAALEELWARDAQPRTTPHVSIPGT